MLDSTKHVLMPWHRNIQVQAMMLENVVILNWEQNLYIAEGVYKGLHQPCRDVVQLWVKWVC